MPKMLATTKMPRGVLNRYRTRMMTADEAFDVPSPKWARFYVQHGWATMVPDESAPEPKRRGRPPGRATSPVAPAVPAAKPSVMTTSSSALVGGVGAALEEKPVQEPTLEEKKTRADLIKMAEERGVELPSGYVPHDKLVDLVGAADDDDDDDDGAA